MRSRPFLLFITNCCWLIYGSWCWHDPSILQTFAREHIQVSEVQKQGIQTSIKSDKKMQQYREKKSEFETKKTGWSAKSEKVRSLRRKPRIISKGIQTLNLKSTDHWTLKTQWGYRTTLMMQCTQSKSESDSNWMGTTINGYRVSVAFFLQWFKLKRKLLTLEPSVFCLICRTGKNRSTSCSCTWQGHCQRI